MSHHCRLHSVRFKDGRYLEVLHRSTEVYDSYKQTVRLTDSDKEMIAYATVIFFPDSVHRVSVYWRDNAIHPRFLSGAVKSVIDHHLKASKE